MQLDPSELNTDVEYKILVYICGTKSPDHTIATRPITVSYFNVLSTDWLEDARTAVTATDVTGVTRTSHSQSVPARSD